MVLTLRTKVCIVGNPTVGKTAIAQMFISDGQQYPKSYNMTLGLEVNSKVVSVPDTEYQVELFLYDVAGAKHFEEMRPSILEGISACIFVYDVTSQKSFEAVKKFYEEIQPYFADSKCQGVIVANKVDLEERVVVKPQVAQDFAKSKGMQLFECSALRGTGLDKPFSVIATMCVEKYQEKMKHFESLLNLS